MAGRSIRRVWQLQHSVFPYEVNDEMAPDLLRPLDEGLEALWTADPMDWVLCASHESSITLGGSWLIGLVKELWPEWQDHLYHDFRYERPPDLDSAPNYE